MTPEVWDIIRKDWKQSLPSVLNGARQIYEIGEDPHYPYGWATNKAGPKSMGITAHYVANTMGYNMEEIEGRRGDKWICRARAMIYLILRKRFPCATSAEIGLRLNKDGSTVLHGLNAAKTRLKGDNEFRETYDGLCREFGL